MVGAAARCDVGPNLGILRTLLRSRSRSGFNQSREIDLDGEEELPVRTSAGPEGPALATCSVWVLIRVDKFPDYST